MNAAEVLMAVREAGAALRVEGDSLVASNASRIAPAIKAAIRENKPHLIAALVGHRLRGRYCGASAGGALQEGVCLPPIEAPGACGRVALAAVCRGRKPVSRAMGRASRAAWLDQRRPVRLAHAAGEATPLLQQAVPIRLHRLGLASRWA
jgi:hypothetical protein